MSAGLACCSFSSVSSGHCVTSACSNASTRPPRRSSFSRSAGTVTFCCGSCPAASGDWPASPQSDAHAAIDQHRGPEDTDTRNARSSRTPVDRTDECRPLRAAGPKPSIRHTGERLLLHERLDLGDRPGQARGEILAAGLGDDDRVLDPHAQVFSGKTA